MINFFFDEKMEGETLESTMSSPQEKSSAFSD